MKNNFRTAYDRSGDLLKFVLTDCGGMDFDSRISVLSTSSYHIEITKGFNLERIYYAYVLLIEQFQISITSLTLSNLQLEDEDFPGGFLDKMVDLLYLDLSENSLKNIPKFNRGLMTLIIDKDVNYENYPEFEEADHFGFEHTPEGNIFNIGNIGTTNLHLQF